MGIFQKKLITPLFKGVAAMWQIGVNLIYENNSFLNAFLILNYLFNIEDFIKTLEINHIIIAELKRDIKNNFGLYKIDFMIYLWCVKIRTLQFVQAIAILFFRSVSVSVRE
jgi:hypothetical protein